jgi:hypothetical protein
VVYVQFAKIRATFPRVQHGGMMLLADFPEMTIAGKHLGAAQ